MDNTEEWAQQAAERLGLTSETARADVRYFRTIWLGVEPPTLDDILALIRYFRAQPETVGSFRVEPE